jgi:hypothetical protein
MRGSQETTHEMMADLRTLVDASESRVICLGSQLEDSDARSHALGTRYLEDRAFGELVSCLYFPEHACRQHVCCYEGGHTAR